MKENKTLKVIVIITGILTILLGILLFERLISAPVKDNFSCNSICYITNHLVDKFNPGIVPPCKFFMNYKNTLHCCKVLMIINYSSI